MRSLPRLFVFLAALLGGALGCAAAPAARPNVLFVNVDDLRDYGGVFTREVVRTPNLDRLAARATRFERAYVQYTVCNPSRSSYLTGLRPEQTGIVNNLTLLRETLPDAVTLPQLFKEAGWRSEGYGKIFHLAGGSEARLHASLDLPRSWHVAQVFRPTPTGQRMIDQRNLTDGQVAWCWWGMAEGTDDDQPDGQTAAAVIAAMDAAGDRPWFIGCGFNKPHDPFVAPKKYFDLHPLETLPLWRDAADLTPVGRAAGIGSQFKEFTDRERREFFRAYLAGVSFMDTQLGRVLDALDRRQLWDRTIVVFLGDHGYHHGERGWWNKNTLFERTCRAPLLIVAPGVKGGRTSRSIVEFVDLMPTLAELAGLVPPPGLAGTSLVPVLRDPARAVKDAALTLIVRGQSEHGRRLRTADWACTRWSDGATELYDSARDPEEQHNLAASRPDVVASLVAQYPELAAPLAAAAKPRNESERRTKKNARP
jgi:uncharacterized sulfatase